jgi:hypothetical protein
LLVIDAEKNKKNAVLGSLSDPASNLRKYILTLEDKAHRVDSILDQKSF